MNSTAETTPGLEPGSRRLGMILYELAYGGVERQAELLAQAAHDDGWQIDLIVLGPSGPAETRFERVCSTRQILQANLHRDRELHKSLAQAVQGKNWDGALIFSTAKIAVISHALKGVATRQAVYVGNPVSSDWLTFGKQQWRGWRFPPSPDLVFLACSEHVLTSLRRDRFFRHFDCRVSWNCVPIPAQPAPLRETCQPLHFGMVARLEKIKDQATLIRSLPLFRNKNDQVILHLVGKGEEEAPLRRLASQLGVMDQVRFEGTLENVFAAMADWDVFAFSTTREEGFGAAAAEAMALGLPCVFTDTGPCREVGGDTVEYVPEREPQAWADTLVNLAANVSRRRQLGQAGRQRALRLFTKERMWHEYRQALGLERAGSVK